MTKEQKAQQKAVRKARVAADNAEQKRIAALPKEERAAAKAVFKQQKATRKAEIKAMPAGDEKKALKSEERRYKRLKNRPRTIAIWATVLALIFVPLGSQVVIALMPDSPEVAQSKAESRIIAEQVQAEGTVLLMNKDNVLPMKNTKVNLFGMRTVTPSFGGGGSGSIGSKNMVGLYPAMTEVGFEPNPDLYNLYSNWAYKGNISTASYTHKEKTSLFSLLMPNIPAILMSEDIGNLTTDQIPPDVLANAKAYSDTAVVMFGLSSRETVNAEGMSDQSKESLNITADDHALLELLNNNFSNIIVIINSGNAMELGFLEEYDNVKGALWMGFPGEVGFNAIAKILSGECNPSGRTVDTFAYDSMSSPAAKLFGHFAYDNVDSQYFVNYSEGVYVGYRFYETFITDEAEYDRTVQFPFGYGLSYTDFAWETAAFVDGADKVDVTVKVTNTGKAAGKDVVQLYVTAPYYPENGIEKPLVELCGFAKTKLLQPGESENVTISVDKRELAAYDYKKLQAFVLEQGEYQLKTARNSHDIVDTKSFTVPDTITYKQDSSTGTEISNLFDQANNGIEYLSRADYAGSLAKIMEIDYTAPQSVIDATAYVITPTEGGTMPTMNAKNGLKLSDLSGVPYEDERWQLFLDQFSMDEMLKLTTEGGWQTAEVKRLGVPKTLDYDGPASYGHYFGKWRTVGFPCEVIVATTWNEQLQYDMAVSMAKEAALRGISVWYAPAMNTHRTPFGARNFEYFSEDPLIAGKAASAMTRGAYTQGIAVTIKHFALNDQDTHRTGIFTWTNEQALREIYLKPFEISVKEGGALGAMTAMNRIGHTWCGELPALLNDLLRDEWGFRGYVVTDITIGSYMKAAKCITNGNDTMLFFTGGSHRKNIEEAYAIDPIGIANGLRTSTHNICYMVVNTNAVEQQAREYVAVTA